MDFSEYLLDTQALRSLPFATIRAAVARGMRLSVSPISLWELLTHLDTTNAKGGFDLRKGWLLKARGLRILDDPFADHAVRVAAPTVAHESRFDDAAILGAVLEALDASPTLTQFYERTVMHRGETRAIKDSSARARKALDDAEMDYVAHVQRMITLMDEQIGRSALRNVDDARYVLVASAGTLKLAEFYKSFGYESPDLVARIFESVYPHMGYVFERARQYALNSPPGSAIKVDPNDTEDGMLCLHLGLGDDRILVTDDKGTRKALGEAGARVARQLAAYGTPRTARLVMTCEEFTVLVNSAPQPSELPVGD